MVSLGGSIFAHNAFKYDYCIKSALESLLALCDEVVCLDAESTDGTYEYLIRKQKQHPKLKIIESKWEQHIEGQPNYDRLAILANEARKELTTDWHFMLQADEVIHEDSFEIIRGLTKNYNLNSIRCLRLNLWGSYDNHIRVNNSPKRPCGDLITRLAKTEMPAVGDAENLQSGSPHLTGYEDKLLIYHYGMVRDPKVFVDKVIDMGMWFWDGNPDPRYVAMKEEGRRFEPKEIMPDIELDPIPKEHPRFAKLWVEERRHFYEI